MSQEKQMRGSAKVHVHISVHHRAQDGFMNEEIASATIADQAVLDRGDGSLLDNERAFTRLVEGVTEETVSKIESTLSARWAEYENEAEAERREQVLSEAQLYISGAETPNERGQREKVLAEFLGTKPGELTGGS